jgi:hypothetical protein
MSEQKAIPRIFNGTPVDASVVIDGEQCVILGSDVISLDSGERFTITRDINPPTITDGAGKVREYESASLRPMPFEMMSIPPDLRPGKPVEATGTIRKPFDAAGHMRKIRTRQGMQDYLDVKWRVAWLRADYPTAQIVTEMIEADADHARCRAAITLPNGGSATAHGSEVLQDFPDFYEKAETKAVGRACALLGYGTDAASDLDDGEPMDGAGAAQAERREAREPNTTQARTPAGQQKDAPPADTLAPSNVHQHAQIRSLIEHGFDLAAWIAANVSPNASPAVEGLTQAQAKAAIIDGRAAIRAHIEANEAAAGATEKAPRRAGRTLGSLKPAAAAPASAFFSDDRFYDAVAKECDRIGIFIPATLRWDEARERIRKNGGEAIPDIEMNSEDAIARARHAFIAALRGMTPVPAPPMAE